MRFQMCSQWAFMRRYKVTLVAFVWLFSTVCFQMCPQIACLRGCKVTLVAFVWFFSTVRYQMSPQIACLSRCIVTLVTFVWLFSTVWLIYSLPLLILVQTLLLLRVNEVKVNVPTKRVSVLIGRYQTTELIMQRLQIWRIHKKVRHESLELEIR